jgi:hypothetical protein
MQQRKPSGLEWRLLSGDENRGHDDGKNRQFTVNHLAIRLESVGSKPKSYYARQIRNWAYRGLLHSESLIGSGRTAGRLFDETAIYRARLLSCLTGLGMKPDQMMPFSQLLEFADSIEDKRVVDHVRSGERIYIMCSFNEDGDHLFSDIRKGPCSFGSNDDNVDTGAPSAVIIDLKKLFDPIIRLEDMG